MQFWAYTCFRALWGVGATFISINFANICFLSIYLVFQSTGSTVVKRAVQKAAGAHALFEKKLAPYKVLFICFHWISLDYIFYLSSDHKWKKLIRKC